MSSTSQTVKKRIPSIASLPREYKVDSAHLSFMIEGAKPTDPNSWQELKFVPGGGTAKGDNVCRLLFDYNLTITQKSKTESCTLKWPSSVLSTSTIKCGAKSFDPIVIEMCLDSKGSIAFDGDIEAAHQLPLAKQRDTIARLKLSIRPSKFKALGRITPALNNLIGHIEFFLSGIDEQEIASRRQRIEEADRTALALARDAREKSRGSFANCRIMRRQGSGSDERFLPGEDYRGTQDERADSDLPVRGSAPSFLSDGTKADTRRRSYRTDIQQRFGGNAAPGWNWLAGEIECG